MAKRVRYLVQIVPHLEDRYGTNKARSIMRRALARYDELLDENADEPKAYHMHTRERIYPAIACFDAMLVEGVDRADAAEGAPFRKVDAMPATDRGVYTFVLQEVGACASPDGNKTREES